MCKIIRNEHGSCPLTPATLAQLMVTIRANPDRKQRSEAALGLVLDAVSTAQKALGALDAAEVPVPLLTWLKTKVNGFTTEVAEKINDVS